MTAGQHIVRTANIHWEGDLARGRGSIATESGKVQADYSFGTRFSGDPGTNPEELLAASHAACFTMALTAALTRAGHPPTSIDSSARVSLEQVQGAFQIPSIELSTTAVVPNISNDDFQRLANEAEQTCPLSKALRAVPISMKAELRQA